jgi:hypothetical protein
MRGGVRGGVKEKAFFVILTKKAKLQGRGMGVFTPEPLERRAGDGMSALELGRRKGPGDGGAGTKRPSLRKPLERLTKPS